MRPIPSRFAAKLARSLARDRDLPLAVKLRKATRYVWAASMAPFHLRACDQVGSRARAVGQPVIENLGRIVIGTDFNLTSSFARTQLRTGPAGSIEIGDSVAINFGSAISAERLVRIGDRVSIGPYSILADSDRPDLSPSEAAIDAQPIVIGKGAWLAGRVTVLPGTNIGENSVITAGSVVSGTIPAGVVAGGIPARVLRRTHDSDLTIPPVSGTQTELATTAPPLDLPATGSTEPSATEPTATPAAQFQGVLIADFTADELAQRLQSDSLSPSLGCELAPFGQVVQTLVEASHQPEAGARDYAIVWTRPQSVVPTFAKLASFEPVNLDDMMLEVDGFSSLVAEASRAFRFVFVPSWVIPTYERGLGPLDLKSGTGVANALLRMNLRLAERLERVPNVYVLNAQKWVEAAGKAAFTPRLWHMGKIPFHSDVFSAAAADIKAAVSGLVGGARKIVIVDLDDTLWGGIVGDAGWENLRLGGHDSTGEAFVEFQRRLKDLTRRGVLLAIASKNDESVALEAIRSHPEMVLKVEDFAGWKITWNDKAQNIADLLAELNLGPQSAVFIDDNPLERARVREALPEVFVPEWPTDKLLYSSALQSLRCFDAPAISHEDAARTRLYAVERERAELKRQVGSLAEWLTTLDIRVRVDELNPTNIQRATQLLNKTNQMNLSTRRLTELELTAWAGEPNHKVWTLSVADRFGEAGLTGMVSLELKDGQARIVDFVLSCRVMGRKIEETMVHVAAEHARELGVELLVARFLPTSKNKPCLDFWQSSGFRYQALSQEFWWPTNEIYPLPAFIRLEQQLAAAA